MGHIGDSALPNTVKRFRPRSAQWHSLNPAKHLGTVGEKIRSSIAGFRLDLRRKGSVHGDRKDRNVSMNLVQPEENIAQIVELDLAGLRRYWHSSFGRHPSKHLSRQILLRLMAYRLQADAYGDLSETTAKILEKIAAGNGDGNNTALGLPGSGNDFLLSTGTILVREHHGVNHRVVVMQDGFSWNGTSYPSLSKVAKAITGTQWNGPRFFGLRDRKAKA